jgi:DNA-binding response OmpR family regulator
VGEIMEERILVVDDEDSIANAIAYGLNKEDYKFVTNLLQLK